AHQQLQSFPTRRSSDLNIKRVFYVACGGSSALTYSSKYIIDRDSKTLSAEVYNSNEFIYRNPKLLDEDSLVIAISHLGNTPETRSEEHTSELQSRFDLV